MANVNDTLAERGDRYGDFATHAQITQDLKSVFTNSPRWKDLNAAMKEGLEMVAHKIGRILNGDPTYSDSWHDIAGYAKLVEDFLIDKSHADAALAPAKAMWKAGEAVPATIVNGVPEPVKEATPAPATFPPANPLVQTVAAPAVTTVTPPKATVMLPPPPVSPVAPVDPVVPAAKDEPKK